MNIWNRLFGKKRTTKQPPDDADVKAATRLLYIDLSNSTNGYRNADTFHKYSDFFTKHYTAEACQHGPREDAFELVCAAKAAGRRFDIIVTNVPGSLRRAPENIRRTAVLDGVDRKAHHDYIESMSYIAAMKQQLDVPILAFTGAGSTDIQSFIATGFVDDFVRDSGFEAFRAQIANLLARYEKLPLPAPPAQINETKAGFSARVCVRINDPLPRSVSNHLTTQCENGEFALLIAAADGLSAVANIPDVLRPGFHLSGNCTVGRMADVYVQGKSDESRTFISDVCTALTSRYVFDIPWIMEIQDQNRNNPNNICCMHSRCKPCKDFLRMQDWSFFEQRLATINDEELRRKWQDFRANAKESDKLWYFTEQPSSIMTSVCRYDLHPFTIAKAMKSKQLPDKDGPGFCLTRRNVPWNFVEERPIPDSLLNELEECSRKVLLAEGHWGQPDA